MSGKTIPNSAAFITDDGNGNLTNNGAVVGWCDYTRGHLEFQHLPNAEFKIYAKSLSAHAGGVNYGSATGYNSISSIKGRSLNAKQKSKVEVLLLG